MANWLLGQSGRSTPDTPATHLRLTSSLQGVPIPVLLCGRNRVGCNLLDYVDFLAIPQSTGGGKGGLVGAGGKGTGKTYKYQTAIIAGLCEGPIASINGVWNNKTRQTLVSLGLGAVLGSYSQTAWGYMTTAHPERARTYRGIAYVSGTVQLGDSPELPNLSFEITSTSSNAIPGAPDGNPRNAITNLLTNDKYGVGFPAELLDANTDYALYTRATGLVVSPVLGSPTEAGAFLRDLLEATNSEAVWTDKLRVVPRGDETVTGADGDDYVPVVTPIYDLTSDDFEPDSGEPPVRIVRRAQSDVRNSHETEYLDRAAKPDPENPDDSRSYDPAVVQARDDASIQAFGLSKGDKKSYHFFCLASAAQMSTTLRLGRERINRKFYFNLGPRFARLDPMDIVTLTEPAVGLDRAAVRILDVQEGAGGRLAMEAEEYLEGVASAPLYGSQANAGHVPDYNADPDAINVPLIFEPPNELSSGALQIKLAVSGISKAIWGGSDVYVSYDDETYQHIGKITGPARMGLLTAPFASYPANPAGQTIDQTNTLSVDLSQSGGTLISGSQKDVLALNTACYVSGGEFIAYKTATLTGPNAYDLSYLVRGAYGTESKIGARVAGTRFCRVDDALLTLDFTPDRIGATVNFKFVSFNIYGGGEQTLADVSAYPYKVLGTALASPMPNVQNVRTTYRDFTLNIDFDEVRDNRGVRYQIWKGDTFATAVVVGGGDIAHPPFVPIGNGTYWIKAFAKPLPGLTVYSEDPASITLTGATLVQNVIDAQDEKALGWPGTLVGSITIAGPSLQTAVGPITAYYEEPSSHWIDASYVRPIRLGSTFKVAGSPADQNILTITDFLAETDVLGSAASAFVDAWAEIALATTPNTDVFAPSDIFAAADVFSGVPVWGAWQKFTAGVYVTRYARRRLAIEVINDSAIGFALEYSNSADVVDRLDRYTDLAVGSGGITITHTPEGGSATPFKGGPNGAVLPHVHIDIRGGAAGDTVVRSSESLSALTFQVQNAAGAGIARHCDVYIQGW